MNTKDLMVFQYTNEVLEVLENSNEMTTSDLQGVISALVKRILEKGKQLK